MALYVDAIGVRFDPQSHADRENFSYRERVRKKLQIAV